MKGQTNGLYDMFYTSLNKALLFDVWAYEGRIYKMICLASSNFEKGRNRNRERWTDRQMDRPFVEMRGCILRFSVAFIWPYLGLICQKHCTKASPPYGPTDVSYIEILGRIWIRWDKVDSEWGWYLQSLSGWSFGNLPARSTKTNMTGTPSAGAGVTPSSLSITSSSYAFVQEFRQSHLIQTEGSLFFNFRWLGNVR